MNPVLSQYTRISQEIGGAAPIPELLSALSSNLRAVSITSATGLSDGQVIALCAVLPLSNLEELTLHNLALNINSWVAIADACSKTKTLAKLTIKDCSTKDGQGVPTFARALGATELSGLDISNFKLGDDFAAGLAEGGLLKGDKLINLRLAGISLGDEGACKLAKAFESVGMMSGLKVMDLSYNRISDKGACALAAMLVSEGEQSSLPLASLELEGNLHCGRTPDNAGDKEISDVGCLALARAAKGALVLSRLNISLNHSTDATLHALAECLRFNTGTLKEVAVAGARAAEDAAIALIKAVTRNNSLQLLDLRGVPLGPEGVAQLCQMMRYTATLSTLRVDVASRDGAEAVARELPNNRSLMHLTMGGPVPETLLAQMSEILAANTMRKTNTSPARSSPHIHAWIENATLGHAVSGHTAAASMYQQQQQQHRGSGRPHSSRSPSPGPGMRSPRSDAGGSVHSHGTYTTTKTARTATSYLSFQYSQMSRKTGISSSPLRLSTSLAAGGAAEQAAVIFRKHDLNQDNYLSREEMMAALQEIGIFNGIRAKHVGRILDHEFRKADWDQDGKISLQDFITYYERIAYVQTQMAREGRIRSASHKQAIPVGVENNPALKRVFKNYCKYALGQGRVYAQEGVPHMNAQQFHRLCQDAGFVEPEGRLSTTAIDVVFHRYRPSGSRRLGFKEFVECLAAVAYEAGLMFEDVMVALGCRGTNVLTPDGSTRNSDAGAPSGPGPGMMMMGVRRTQDELLMDPSFANLMAPGLESIQEVPTPLTGGLAGGPGAGMGLQQQVKTAAGGAVGPPGGKKLKKKVGAGSGRVGGGSQSSVSNPLFESMEGRQVATSSFDISGAGNKSAAASAADARYRMELEHRLAVLEGKLMAGAAGSGNLQGVIGGGVDAGVTASSIAGRLSKLEATISQAVVKQEAMEGVSRQMEGLQDILGKLAEEMTRMKLSGMAGSLSADAAARRASSVSQGGVDPVAHAALTKQVESMSVLVGQLAGDVRGMMARMDAMSSQLTSLQLKSSGVASAGGTADGGAAAAGGLVGVGSEMLAALEKRLSDRQARFEGALMQVARQVDVLDAKLKEEQETSLRALETIIASSQGGAPAAAAGGPLMVAAKTVL